MDRKNYSMYMPADFSEKLTEVQKNNPSINALSKSQAVYYIISQLAEGAVKLNGQDPEDEEVSEQEG